MVGQRQNQQSSSDGTSPRLLYKKQLPPCFAARVDGAGWPAFLLLCRLVAPPSMLLDLIAIELEHEDAKR
jgi:hypothetical protein